MNNVAVMVRNGHGGAKDFAEARKWFRLAADLGLPEAQVNLGVMCELGEGAPQDFQAAHDWFFKAADQGNSSAQFNLGVLYERGLGVPQNHVEAARWYHLAANRGDAAAQLNLGMLYCHGQGVLQDYVESHKWLNLAAARFIPADADKRARALKNRELVTRKMTASQIAEAQVLARDWRPRDGSQQPSRDARTPPTMPRIHAAIDVPGTPTEAASQRRPRWLPG